MEVRPSLRFPQDDDDVIRLIGRPGDDRRRISGQQATLRAKANCEIRDLRHEIHISHIHYSASEQNKYKMFAPRKSSRSKTAERDGSKNTSRRRDRRWVHPLSALEGRRAGGLGDVPAKCSSRRTSDNP
ncbi:hypothetical protein EVAR_12329_1 [Eumeta japonica]|uniref:Uncharacterized protein n=1 Tax=Eumeta variegata TaxID=151549 RepID=A0A4C1ZV17_EUMVA|nr:hypothetical protein EVAR_12329_1 [Eumeta japonica]